MIKNGKYRFTLQFGMRTSEEKQAGELLEQLGKRKSPIVVAALNEYLENHPELLQGKANLNFHVLAPDEKLLEEKIREIIESQFGTGSAFPTQRIENPVEATKEIQDDIFEMLNDLDCFG